MRLDAGNGGYLGRLARAACPRAERPWLDALFAELATIEGAWPRRLWLLGAVQLVAARNVERLGAGLVRHLNLAIVAALAGATAAATFSRSGHEALGDDDVFIGLALVFAAAGVALLGLAGVRTGSGGPPSRRA